MKEKKIREAQNFIKELGADGWLLFDFHKSNYLAHLFLEIPEGAMVTRRFFYWIPVEGEPIKIVHAIEPHVLDGWPGVAKTYLSWQSLRKEVGAVLSGAKRVAMEYSPMNNNPYVSFVDGGTVDLVCSFGAEVISSGSFLAHFTAVIDANQGESQIRAATALNQIVEETWRWIGEHLLENKPLNEYQIQQRIVREIEQRNLITESAPIVGINAHSADPHFQTEAVGSTPIRKGDLILIDLWGKEKQEGAVFGDLTRVAVASEHPTARQKLVFDTVRSAQKAGIDLIKKRFSEKKKIMGFEVDDAVRKVINDAGFGSYFVHKTGHSIEVHLHGSGTHMDNLEMHDDRPILKGTCFSIEPGIYLPDEFGIRLESDVYIHGDGKVEVTGGEQDEIRCLL